MNASAFPAKVLAHMPKRAVVLVFVGISAGVVCSGQEPMRILRTAPRPKAAEFSGSEVLSLLGIVAAKAEVPLTRSYRNVRAQIVISKPEGDEIVESQLEGSLEMPLFAPDNKVTVGFAVLPEKRTLKLILEGAMADVPMPANFAYDFPTLSPTGIYEDGLVIFAYEANGDEKPVRGKAEMKRYLGVRIHLTD